MTSEIFKDISLTPTEQQFMSLLEDGKPHSRDELRKLLPDDMGADKTITIHILNIRKKIRPLGYLIMIEFNRKRFLFYRLCKSVETD